jgi:hypothetical protein
MLDVHGGDDDGYVAFHTNLSGNTDTDGALVGLQAGTNNAYLWNYENGWLYFGTNSSFRMSINPSGNVGIGTTAPTHTLSVNGTASKTGGGLWSVFSDRRLKDLHGSYDKGLTEILALQPVVFNYKAGNPLDLPSDVEEIGLVAQDVQQIFPEAVKVSSNGYLDFNMHPINVAFVNAIKELKSSNDELRAVNESLQGQVDELASRLAEIEKMLKQ